MAKRKNAKSNTAKTPADAKTPKGKNAKTPKAKEIVLGDLGCIYKDKLVNATFTDDGEYLLIKCKVNCTKSGSGKSFTLVSLGGIKNGKCEQIGESFGTIGGYFSVLCGYTQGAKEE